MSKIEKGFMVAVIPASTSPRLGEQDDVFSDAGEQRADIPGSVCISRRTRVITLQVFLLFTMAAGIYMAVAGGVDMDLRDKKIQENPYVISGIPLALISLMALLATRFNQSRPTVPPVHGQRVQLLL